MRKSLAVAVTALSVAGVGALVPTAANAACTGPCTATATTTVTVGTLGLLSIAEVGTGALVTTGNSASGALGVVTVTDTRVPAAGATNAWTVSASSTDFSLVNVSGTTIPALNNVSICYGSPSIVPAASAALDGTYACGTGLLGLTNSPATFVTATTQNANTDAYTPTLTVNIPNGTAVGVYTGTVTQTVS